MGMSLLEFKNQKEIYEALLAGKVLVSYETQIACLDNNGILIGGNFGFSNPEDWSVLSETVDELVEVRR
ncbi:hypothetical protein KAU11_07170 [Candidatus Babeliales bacterium]|nr:hypothetical protein [Candidatus Babeliales bacterium]